MSSAPIVAPANHNNMSGLIRERVGTVLGGLPVQRVSIELTSLMLTARFDFPLADRHKAGLRVGLRPPLNLNAGGIHQALAPLDRPGKHHPRSCETREANRGMMRCRQGVHAFLRIYYHHKSVDWPGKKPTRLEGRTAAEPARMLTNHIMGRGRAMAETVVAEMPSRAAIDTCAWLPDHQLRVNSGE